MTAVATIKRSMLDVKIGDVIDCIYRPEKSVDREPRWHLLQCMGASDTRVIDWLKEAAIETYYPKTRELARVPLRKLPPSRRNSDLPVMRSAIRPLFPRYIFASFDVMRDDWSNTFRRAGVRGLVCAGEQPFVVPDSLISGLRSRENSQGVVPGQVPLKIMFDLGDHVRVNDGPFSGFHANVEQAMELNAEDVDGDTRIKVLIDFFGRMVPVELLIWQIDKA